MKIYMKTENASSKSDYMGLAQFTGLNILNASRFPLKGWSYYWVMTQQYWRQEATIKPKLWLDIFISTDSVLVCVTNVSPMSHQCVTNVSPCKLVSAHVARVLLCKTKPGFAMWFRQTHKHHRQLDYIRVMSFKVLLAYKVPPHTNPPSDFAKQSSATPSNLCNSCTSTEITKLTSNNSLKL